MRPARYASGVDDALTLVCEPATAPQTLERALELRRAGTHFVLAARIPDARERAVRERGAEAAARFATWDEVRLTLDAASAGIAALTTVAPDAQVAALIEAIRLSDGVAVRSWNEHGRLRALLGAVPRETEIVIVPDPGVPAAVSGERTDVVVYAPHDRGAELAAFVTALADLEVPVTFIARDAPPIPSKITFVAPERGAEALGRARVILDASAVDPGTAIALAALGRPLVVSAATGAAEVVRGVNTFDSWNRRSILAAVANALGAPAPRVQRNAFVEIPTPKPAPAFGSDAPLVSIVLTTYNRPTYLTTTLASIERQTYPNLEILVVNDAGADVSGIVATASRARYLVQPENRGPAAARNRGLAEARGTYVQLFDDDDQMFPDHVASLVTALLRSGLDVVYGQNINTIHVRDDAGGYKNSSLAGHVALLDHADIQWAGALATTALMFRRSLISEIGGVDEAFRANEDFEFWMRLAAGREWARVADITSLYVIRLDGTTRSSLNKHRFADAHAAIYGKHPSDRALVNAGRTSILNYLRTAAND